MRTVVYTAIQAVGTLIALRWWVTAMTWAAMHPAAHLVNGAVSTVVTVLLVFLLWRPPATPAPPAVSP